MRGGLLRLCINVNDDKIVEYRTKPMFLSLTSPLRGVTGHVRTEGHEQDRK